MAKINYKFHVSKSFYSTFSLCSHIGELSQRALLVAFIFIFILYIYYCADTKVEPTNFSFQVKINIKISSKSIILFIFVIFFVRFLVSVKTFEVSQQASRSLDVHPSFTTLSFVVCTLFVVCTFSSVRSKTNERE